MNSSSIGARLNLLNLLMLLALCGAGGAGIYGVVGLERMLAFVTGPAWQTADSAMETEMGLQREMLAVERVLRESGSTASVANYEQAHHAAEVATSRLLSTDTLLPANVIETSRRLLGDYAAKRDRVLTSLRSPALATGLLDRGPADVALALVATEQAGDMQVVVAITDGANDHVESHTAFLGGEMGRRRAVNLACLALWRWLGTDPQA